MKSPFQSCMDLRLASATEPEQTLPLAVSEAADTRGPLESEPEQALPPVPTASEAADTRFPLDADETQLDTEACEADQTVPPIPTAAGAADTRGAFDTDQAQLDTRNTCELEGFPSVDMKAGDILTRRMQHGLVNQRRADSLLQICLSCMHRCRQIWQICKHS